MKKLLVISSMVLWGSLAVADWWITDVDIGSTGPTAIILDSLEYPHITYGHEGKGHRRYASWTLDSTWIIETVGGWIGSTVGFEFDSSYRSHIAWMKSYGYRDSVGWHIEDMPWGGDISFTLDQKYYPHILEIQDDIYVFVLHYYLDSLGWHCDTIEQDIDIGSYSTSIAIDDTGYIHIVYQDGNKLVYQKKTMEWRKEIIDSVIYSPYLHGFHPSLVIDKIGALCIAYRGDSVSGQITRLRYATRDSTEWNIVIIDSKNACVDDAWADGIISPSLCVDSNNHPHICYSDRKRLLYSWFDGTLWHTTVIDTLIYDKDNIKSSGCGSPYDLVIDKDGYSHISYKDETKQLAKYAKGCNYIGIEEKEELSSSADGLEFKVLPNLFNTIIRLQIVDCRVQVKKARIQIYDLAGKEIKTFNNLTDNYIIWNAKEIPAGIYFCKLFINKQEYVNKIIKLK